MGQQSATGATVTARARVVVLVIAALVLAACGGDDAATEELAEPTAAAPTATRTAVPEDGADDGSEPEDADEPATEPTATPVEQPTPTAAPEETIGAAALDTVLAAERIDIYAVDGDVALAYLRGVEDDPDRVGAVDLTTGAVLWEVDVEIAPLPLNVALIAGTAIFPLSFDEIVGIDAATGEERFRRDWSPTLFDDQALYLRGRTAEAIDAATGTTRWTLDDFGPRVHTDGTLVLERFDAGATELLGVEPETGAERWRRTIAEPDLVPVRYEPDSAPVSAVLMPSAGELVAIDPSGGEDLWRIDLAGFAPEGVSVVSAGGYAVLCGSDGSERRVVVVDLADGATRFERPFEGSIIALTPELLLSDGNARSSGDDCFARGGFELGPGPATAVDATSGEVAWRVDATEARFEAGLLAPATAAQLRPPTDLFVVDSGDGVVTTQYRLSDGAPVAVSRLGEWQTAVGDSLMVWLAEPSELSGRLVIDAYGFATTIETQELALPRSIGAGDRLIVTIEGRLLVFE